MKKTFRQSLIRLTTLLVAVAIVPVATAQENETSEEPSFMSEIDYEGLPRVKEGRLSLPSLAPPSIATDDIGNGRIPDGFRGTGGTPTFPLPESGSLRAEVWNWSICNWAAADTFSNPRYFEDRMLERHGHQRFGKYLEPAASGARFFVTVPMLPYLWALRDPCDCEYTLGYYRSGTCAPGLMQRPPYDRRAMIMEAAVVAGVVVAFP